MNRSAPRQQKFFENGNGEPCGRISFDGEMSSKCRKD
jgi:hypothetical protein